jgi:hypothetical protein
VLLGNGDGIFQRANTYAGNTVAATSVTVADFNGDARSDLAVANQNANTVSILLGSTVFSASSTKVGIFRNGAAFLEDSNGNGAYDAGFDRFIPSFTGTGGFMAGDYPVIGDWTGDGHAKVGIYRQTPGEWFLDLNNNGVFDSGDVPIALPGSSATYRFGGVTGDLPVVGDWLGTGKSCIGVFRSGFFWVFDLNCNGTFDGTDAGQDAAFPFGGLSGDVPVVGAWTGGIDTSGCGSQVRAGWGADW